MPKVNNIASTAHSQYAEMKAKVDDLQTALEREQELRGEAETSVNTLTAELAAEKEAHAATQAALAAATATKE